MAKLIYARGRPESVSLKETYHYEIEISRNQSMKLGQLPQGELEIAVPYDGHRYFSRQACSDVEHQLNGANPNDDVDAQIGHVLFGDYERTDLKSVLDLGNRYDALPIRVPVVCDEIFQPEQLYDDRHAALISHTYTPRPPDVLPVQFDMQIMDEDSFETPIGARDATAALADWDATLERIKSHGNFQHSLILALQVSLELPDTLPADAVPQIARASFDWPTLTSLRTLKLVVDDQQSLPVRYDPAQPCLEWKDVEFSEVKSQRPKIKTFVSPRMLLHIGHPGELYQQPALAGTVEFEAKQVVLSGVQMRVYDGAGAQIQQFTPELTTRVVVKFSLILDDAFARRVLSPYQHLFFDEVIPDRMRLDDIETTLRDYGFRKDWDRLHADGTESLHYILAVQRPEGPDSMQLWVFVDGERYPTERQTELAGGQIYTSTFISGELKVHMLGQLPGNTRELTRVMNAVQAALCDRFARLRAKR